MKKIIQIIRKIRDKQVLQQYWRAHVLVFAVLQTIILGLSEKSQELARLAVRNKLLNKLRKKYRGYIAEYRRTENRNQTRRQGNKVWVCWLQGMEYAPALVKRCYQSLHEHIHDKDIILLTQNNYQDYIQFPEYIQTKIDSGKISKTHMSDLLRLEVLIRYGGTWIDSTVYCSGSEYPDYILNSELFLYQCLKPGLNGHPIRTSNWMITAASNNRILLLTRALLYDYWKNHNGLMDYWIFHYFFELAIETYPEEWNKVIPFCNSVPFILGSRLFDQYDEEFWNALKKQTCFHKLSYKHNSENFEKKNTYYKVILEKV